MSLASLYTDVVDIYRPTSVTSGTGAVTQTFTIVTSSVACEVQPRRQDYKPTDKGLVKTATHRGFFDLGTDILRGDRVRLDSSYEPVYFDVTSVENHREDHFEVDLNEVNEETIIDGTGTS